MPTLVWRGEELEALVERKVRRRVLKALVDFYEKSLDALFRAPKTGRIYGAEQEVSFTTKGGASVSFTANKGKVFGAKTKSGKTSRKAYGVHQASAPGEAPAIDKGFLAESVTHQYSDGGYDIGVTAQGGRVAAANALEWGTDTIEARPAWRPAFERLRAEADEVIAKALQREESE